MFASRWMILRSYNRSLWHPVWSRCRFQSTSEALASSISPALLGRARAIAAEHAQLAKQLNSEYATDLARKAGSLSAVAKALNGWESANNVGHDAAEFHTTVNVYIVSTRITTAGQGSLDGRGTAKPRGRRAGNTHDKVVTIVN